MALFINLLAKNSTKLFLMPLKDINRKILQKPQTRKNQSIKTKHLKHSESKCKLYLDKMLFNTI